LAYCDHGSAVTPVAPARATRCLPANSCFPSDIRKRNGKRMIVARSRGYFSTSLLPDPGFHLDILRLRGVTGTRWPKKH